MSDYCGECCCTTNSGSGSDDKKVVKLEFYREELLYDIRNYAFVEGDVLGEENQHAQHVLVDVGEEGNVDRVNRILAVVHAAVIEILYPLTKLKPIEETINDRFFTPEKYVVELHLTDKVSRTTVHLLSRLIHEFMVYSVLADWLSITNPSAAQNWAAKAAAVKEEIEDAKNTRGSILTRATHPW